MRLLFSELAKNDDYKAFHEGGFNRLLSHRDTTQLGTPSILVCLMPVTGDNTLGRIIGKRTEYSLEVGWGTVEVIIGE